MNKLSGQTFGLLTVLDKPAVSGKVVCQCLCGGMKWTRPSHLRSGKTKSCGCLRKTAKRSVNERSTTYILNANLNDEVKRISSVLELVLLNISALDVRLRRLECS